LSRLKSLLTEYQKNEFNRRKGTFKIVGDKTPPVRRMPQSLSNSPIISDRKRTKSFLPGFNANKFKSESMTVIQNPIYQKQIKRPTSPPPRLNRKIPEFPINGPPELPRLNRKIPEIPINSPPELPRSVSPRETRPISPTSKMVDSGRMAYVVNI